MCNKYWKYALWWQHKTYIPLCCTALVEYMWSSMKSHFFGERKLFSSFFLSYHLMVVQVMLTQETSTISFQCYFFRINLYWSKLWRFPNLANHCRHMPSLISNKCIYHLLSLIQQISSMKSIIYLLSLIFVPVTSKKRLQA